MRLVGSNISHQVGGGHGNPTFKGRGEGSVGCIGQPASFARGVMVFRHKFPSRDGSGWWVSG